MSISASPRVSVVIPCFNLGHLIGETITSVRMQTYRNFEVIIVNDGSTDPRSLEVLKGLEQTGLMVINQENRGVSGARNTGIRSANGAYISCLDSDDLYDPTFLEESVALLEEDKNRELGTVTTYLTCFGGLDEVMKTGDHDPVLLLRKNQLHCASLFRKEAWTAVGGYDESMVDGYEDWDFWISLVESGYRWTVIEKSLFRYRVRQGSLSSRASGKRLALFCRIMSNHPELYQRHASAIIQAQFEEITDLEKRILMGQLGFEDIKNAPIWKFLTSGTPGGEPFKE